LSIGELRDLGRDGMRDVPIEEYLDFVSRNKSIIVENQVIQLEPIEVKSLSLYQGN